MTENFAEAYRRNASHLEANGLYDPREEHDACGVGVIAALDGKPRRQVVEAAIAALPPGLRRKLMVTCDGAGASHDLIKHLDKLAARRGYELTYAVGRGARRPRARRDPARPAGGLADRHRSARRGARAPQH